MQSYRILDMKNLKSEFVKKESFILIPKVNIYLQT